MHDSTGVPDDPQRCALPQAHGDEYACQTLLTSMETKLVMQCTSGFAARTRSHVSSTISTGMACTRSLDVTGAHAHRTTTSSQSPDRDVADFSFYFKVLNEHLSRRNHEHEAYTQAAPAFFRL